jgi:hypothetical protein
MAGAYQRLQMALLPPGKLWRLYADSLLGKLFLACGDELERVDVRAADLMNEADPTTATETLPEYEAMLEFEAAGTTAERRARIVSQLIAQQGYRPADLQSTLARLLGLEAADVEVIERANADAVAIGDVREIYRFFIHRDPTLPGDYSIEAAQDLVDLIKPSHTIAHVIESVAFLCDDPFSLCDRDLIGDEDAEDPEPEPGMDVTLDATSEIYCPIDATEWGIVATEAGVSAPSFGWDMQDAAGALAPSVGGVSLASEGIRQDYQQAVAGWSRFGLRSRGDGWFSNDAAFPDISTGSQLILVYAKQSISGGASVDMLWAGNFSARGIVNVAAHMVARNDTTLGVAGTEDVTGAVRPYVLKVDRATSLIKLYSDQEVVDVAIGGVTGKGVYVVGGLLGDDTTFLIGACWSGAAAEMTDAEVRTLLQTLGWTVAW